MCTVYIIIYSMLASLAVGMAHDASVWCRSMSSSGCYAHFIPKVINPSIQCYYYYDLIINLYVR